MAFDGPIHASTGVLGLGYRQFDAIGITESLDDVALWSRALSADEIAFLYAQFAEDFAFTNVGAGAITEEDDVVAGTGTYYPPNVGAGAITEADDVVEGTGDSGALVGTGAITEADDVVSGAGALKNIGTAAYADEDDTVAATGTLPIDVVEPWSLNVSHPLTQLPLTGLGDTTVKFEAYQESTVYWFNSATSALQVAQPTPLALLEDVSGNHPARYAANATITVFNLWMILHWYYDYDASDGRGSVRYHSWVRAYYNDGVQILPGLTVAQAFQLAEKPILSQIVGALPDIVAIQAVVPSAAANAAANAAAIDAAIMSDGLTYAQAKIVNNAILHGKVTGAGTATESFWSVNQAGVLVERARITVDASGNRTAVAFIDVDP